MNDENLNRVFTQVIESAEDVIIITEAEPLHLPGPRILYVNPAFERLTGYSKEEVIGLTPRILQGKKTSEKTKERISKALKNHEISHETILNYTKSGHEYWLDIKIVPLFDKNNNIAFFAAIERDVTEIKQLQARLKELATEDPLTKILNRNAFFHIANNFFQIFKRDRIPFSILLLDIDDFKKVNDKYGHLIGDDAIRWISNIIRQHIRKADILARYGGEEFIILLPDTEVETAKEVALSIKDFLNENKLDLKGSPILITASIGASQVAKDDISLEQVVNRADMLLLKAKHSNKNCVMV